MPASDVPSTRFPAEPQRTLLTPSASPSVGPPDRPPAKRPRLRSTPSSAISATPSTSNESATSSDVNSARRASTLRVLNTWAQLAERYNKRLDEDDVLDLHRFVIAKDRGVVEGASKDYLFGHSTLDSDQDDPDADQEDSEQEDDENELNALPPSETATDDEAQVSKKELLRGVPPLSATTDAEDLREFLETEKRRRELAGDEEDDEGMSPEQLFALREEIEERSKKKEAALANQTRGVASVEPALENEVVDITPTRPSTRVPPSDDESEDELAVWTHDESTAVYPIAWDESEPDVHEVEQEAIELDSDEEFEAILTHPPRFSRVSPLPISQPKEVTLPLQSPPDSERGRSKSRARSRSKIKSAEMTPKSEGRPRSPVVTRKPEVALTRSRKPSVLKETIAVTPDDEKSVQEVVGRISSMSKGKGKETLPPVEDSHRQKAPKSLRAMSQGRKRKRIVSSSISGSPSSQSLAEPKTTPRRDAESISHSSTTLAQPDSEPTLGEDVSTPARFEPLVPGPSRVSTSFFSTSISRPLTPTYRSLEPELVQPTSHHHSTNGPLLSDIPTPVNHSYSQRHPSRPPSTLPSPNQRTPGLSLPGYPPPPLDPVQTQQAHYLLAQAMHQLSYVLSAAMPPYAGYGSNPAQPWQHPPPLPPPPPLPLHAAYSTPTHPPHFHSTHRYQTPSSSISHSDLPPSSPVRSSVSPVSPPFEEHHSCSRGRSKSRGRRVSFKIDSEEVVVRREHNIQPDPQYQNRKQSLEVKRGRRKGKSTKEFDDPLRLEEDRGSPPREVARGRTPGPPDRQKIDMSRGRSLSRRQ